jgi:hypothetical protein
MLLANIDLHTRTRLYLIQSTVREFAIVRVAGNLEVHVSNHCVGVSALDQRLNHRHHVVDFLSR